MSETDKMVNSNKLSYFSMSEDCIYSFIVPQVLHTFPLRDKPGYLAVTKNFDDYFVGIGKNRGSALYDWKVKFHCYFQRFSLLGTREDWEKELFDKMQDLIDMTVYDANTTSATLVYGTINSCREGELCPCSYRLDGSADIYQVPAYEYVDSTFFLLNKGEHFRAVFEYRNRDNKLSKILYAEPFEGGKNECRDKRRR